MSCFSGLGLRGSGFGVYKPKLQALLRPRNPKPKSTFGVPACLRGLHFRACRGGGLWIFLGFWGLGLRGFLGVELKPRREEQKPVKCQTSKNQVVRELVSSCVGEEKWGLQDFRF